MNKMLKCLFGFSAAVVICLAGAPAYASASDDLIVENFEKTYVFRAFLSDEAISTEAKDGAITLTGTVAVDSQRLLAQETAENVPGVTSVNNKLVTVAEVATDKADYWIGKKVKLNLYFHRHVNAGKTKVSVRDGIVTLRGEAATAAQKDLTTAYAKDVDGVKDVTNLMTLAAAPKVEERTPAEKIDDASVVAQVKTALRTHRSTSNLDTKVVAREGEVTVTGTAKNEAEKTLVTKLATDIHGVTTVKNEMTIQEPQTK
ncbi:MAG: transport-associated protein [Candidatus Riflebacteria bacterium HGW-Riflebacteria-1]|jgi:osmotically-inducible protein OsmY|nr:MAG: transport-associated protein [Candidatus Riflebacteria bacterium HGW-Riflebacteria-1]